MYVSVNENNEIKKVGIDESLKVLYVDENADIFPFKGWSEAKICCYKVNVNDEGIITMMTPYIDSRLIEHFDQLGVSEESNEKNITEVELGVCDLYETVDEVTTENQDQITNLELAVCDLYELIGG